MNNDNTLQESFAEKKILYFCIVKVKNTTKLFEMKVNVRSLSGNLVNFKIKEQGRHTLITCGYAFKQHKHQVWGIVYCSKVYQSRQIDRQCSSALFLFIHSYKQL